MFLLELTYVAPTDQVDTVRAEHMAWVDAQFQTGVFLLSGRKQAQDGGVILAAGDDRAAVEALVASDPFTVAGVAEYRITQFSATRAAPVLQAVLGPPTA
ncbi:YciI family protein [Rhodococcus sp. X156]|uniref:YciI family protein n=1 Tax=Rhodococcus sp. X156 TaxID=2499145 RepID=UPI000FD990CB|nr:YciI family protein [Rhodococcus sp. X156]